jgi:hypothetical protein
MVRAALIDCLCCCKEQRGRSMAGGRRGAVACLQRYLGTGTAGRGTGVEYVCVCVPCGGV